VMKPFQVEAAMVSSLMQMRQIADRILK
jgi:hypothetical protein